MVIIVAWIDAKHSTDRRVVESTGATWRAASPAAEGEFKLRKKIISLHLESLFQTKEWQARLSER